MKQILVISILFICIVSCSNKKITKQTLNKNVSKLHAERWYLIEMNGKKYNSASVYIDLNFKDLKMNGQSFCNTIFSNIELKDETKIKFTNLGMTMMACQAMALENEFNSLLEKVKGYSIIENSLFLYDVNNKNVLSFNKIKGANNTASESTFNYKKSPFTILYDIWGLKKIKGQELPNGKSTVLELNTKEMSFLSYGFCNDIIGKLSNEFENVIVFNKISTTKMNCNDLKLESFYIETLKEVNFYKLKGSHLFLLDKEDKVLLDFVKID